MELRYEQRIFHKAFRPQKRKKYQPERSGGKSRRFSGAFIRNGYYDIYNENDIETDKSLNSSTVFRCLVHTVNELTNISSESQDKIRKFLMLTSYRLRIYSVSQGLTDKSRFSLDINYADKLASDIQGDLLSCDYNTKPQDIPKDKTFTKTIIKESEKFIKQEIQNKLKKQKQQ